MSKHQTVDYVRHFAHQLRNADPAAYQAFLEAFDAYATEFTVAVTEAAAEHILNLQGRAKQTLVILETLRNPKPLVTPQPQTAAP